MRTSAWWFQTALTSMFSRKVQRLSMAFKTWVGFVGCLGERVIAMKIPVIEQLSVLGSYCLNPTPFRGACRIGLQRPACVHWHIWTLWAWARKIMMQFYLVSISGFPFSFFPLINPLMVSSAVPIPGGFNFRIVPIFPETVHQQTKAEREPFGLDCSLAIQRRSLNI